MKKEFNLSDYARDNNMTTTWAVKEFIRRDTELLIEFVNEEITFLELMEKRDKLVGDKLK